MLRKVHSAASLTRSGSGRLLDATAQHVHKHLSLLRTDSSSDVSPSGRTTFHIEYNVWVALSSLLYMAVSAVFVAHGRWTLAATFTTVSVCSVLADSVTPHSHLANVADRLVATVTGILYPVRITVWPGAASVRFRVFIVYLTLICMCLLAWSRSCTTQAQYVVRHSLWHAVSAMGLVYLAHKDSAGLMHDIASL